MPYNKKIPTFIVPKLEFAFAQFNSLAFWNTHQSMRAKALIDHIVTQKKLPDNFNDFYPKPVIAYENFKTNNIQLALKISKKLQPPLEHSFISISGQLFALDNKKRHRTINPFADGLLGKGSFGKVKLAKTLDEKLYAVKIQQRTKIDIALLNRTWGILSKLNYLIVGGIIDQKIYTVTNFFKGPNLWRYLNNKNLSQDNALNIALKASLALEYLHKKNLIHGDIKEDNFMFTESENGKIIIIDFDSSWDLDNLTQGRYSTFVNKYSAPETLGGTPYYSKAADIYQLGHIFQNLQNRYKLNLKTTIDKMLMIDFKQRPEIKAVIRELQKTKENMREEFLLKIFKTILLTGFAIGSFAFISSSTLTALTILPLIAASFIALGIMKKRDSYKHNAFEKLLADQIDPYELSEDRLKALKTNTCQFRAFEDGYQVNQNGGLFDKAKTWLHWRNYSKAYYAGVRWHELNPQDPALEKENTFSQPQSMPKLA